MVKCHITGKFIGEEFIPQMATRIIIQLLNRGSAVVKEQIAGKLVKEGFIPQMALRIIITSLNEEWSAEIK